MALVSVSRQTRDRLASRLETGSPVIPLVVFGLGLLLGWWLLGWWVYPVVWTDAAPADLHAEWQRTYVQLVADTYVRDDDLEAARWRLDGIQGEALADVLSHLVFAGADPMGRQNARRLATNLAVALAEPAGQPAPEPSNGRGLAGLTGNTALALLLAATAAGVVLSWAWLRGGTGARSGPARNSSVPDEFASPPPAISDRPGSAPPWRPERIDLGNTVTASYHTDDDRFYQTWLVYDERGGLIGGAGLQAQPIGNVNALELWFFERDEEGEDVETPIVTIVSHAAYSDKVFRARLGDRNVIPAIPGQRTVLETTDLALEARIRSVDPEPDSTELNLSAVTLSLTPRRDSNRGATESMEDEEPPVPLPFRRD